ncbi:tyrosine-type recombinase/integrase [Paludisphaera sp.]|uniref:tyrosine-type recombinase/integrase n=1 Tax=Paludisphaera sp. TaxID=2017432 RepID=UPI00301CF7B9
MGRKNGHWYSEAGGKPRYFGKIVDTSKAEAMSRLWKALADDDKGPDMALSAHDPEPTPKAESQGAPSPAPASVGVSSQEPQGPTWEALTDAYLSWIEANRSGALHREARRHLGRWNEAHGERPVASIRGDDLEAFRETLLAQGHARMYVQKHATTIKACVNRGIRLRLLPKGFKPFDGIEGLRIPPKALLESDLPTAEEVRALIAHAKPEFGAMLKVYYHTGARTHELIEARAGDYQAKARSLVLTKHKRSSTLREYRPRSILLNDEACSIVEARCRGREPGALIFPNRAGNAFTSCLLGDMFARLRSKAGVREHITIYSLMHLWISEMLMAGHDALIVARMAGTSVKMIEQVYGHFRHRALADAQATLDRARGRV